ncbi:protein kinase domain-containing protein [Lysinibacillus pakistanensis]|uniref:protein kinase domain-containing protein n=1 Tax=Lysinibacillus pakistanensis TaxID=759811 RepID=UPI003D2D1322
MANEESKNVAKEVSSFIKQNKNSIILKLGEVSDLKQIGQGGNGLVYSGIQNNQEVAIKFLVENKQSSKLQRFKAEYFNINLLEDRSNIVNYINYEEVTIENEMIPAIIMKKYDTSLKSFRNDNPEINEKTFVKLFYFLLNSLKKIHVNGIIHRDIKPENILVTKEVNFVLTDFGIASYNPDLYTLKAKTEKGDRLANYEFSAPEQAMKGAVPAPSMDIYALGQVCQWYVFGSTHRGTYRRSITEIFQSEEAELIDIVINKCLNNNHEQRYQSVSDILNHIDSIKESRRKVDPFDEMDLLNEAITATCPSISRGVQFLEDEKYIKRLVENINKQNFKDRLWYNTGTANNKFSNLKYLGNKKIKMDDRELKVKGICLYTTGRLYDDLIIIETEENEPFTIDGKQVYHTIKINNKHLVDADALGSRHIEIEDEVHKLSDLQIEEFNRSNDYKFYFIGTEFHSSIIPENDNWLRLFQIEGNTDEKVLNLIKTLRMKKHKKVLLRL